jgi:hypothetical protein
MSINIKCRRIANPAERQNKFIYEKKLTLNGNKV